MEFIPRRALLSSPEDIVDYAKQLQKASLRFIPNAKVHQNSKDYLECKTYKTDRKAINAFDINITCDYEERSKVLGLMRSPFFEKFQEEKHVYQMYYSGLMAKLTAVKFFHNDNWTSRKLAFAHPEECISLVKLIADPPDSIDLVAFLRSSSNRMLAIDFFGLYWVMCDIESDYLEETKLKFKHRNLTLIVSDYQHIGGK